MMLFLKWAKEVNFIFLKEKFQRFSQRYKKMQNIFQEWVNTIYKSLRNLKFWVITLTKKKVAVL